jgi:hypothetical protein
MPRLALMGESILCDNLTERRPSFVFVRRPNFSMAFISASQQI